LLGGCFANSMHYNSCKTQVCIAFATLKYGEEFATLHYRP